jgi:hypothetical protein
MNRNQKKSGILLIDGSYFIKNMNQYTKSVVYFTTDLIKRFKEVMSEITNLEFNSLQFVWADTGQNERGIEKSFLKSGFQTEMRDTNTSGKICPNCRYVHKPQFDHDSHVAIMCKVMKLTKLKETSNVVLVIGDFRYKEMIKYFSNDMNLSVSIFGFKTRFCAELVPPSSRVTYIEDIYPLLLQKPVNGVAIQPKSENRFASEEFPPLLEKENFVEKGVKEDKKESRSEIVNRKPEESIERKEIKIERSDVIVKVSNPSERSGSEENELEDKKDLNNMKSDKKKKNKHKNRRKKKEEIVNFEEVKEPIVDWSEKKAKEKEKLEEDDDNWKLWKGKQGNDKKEEKELFVEYKKIEEGEEKNEELKKGRKARKKRKKEQMNKEKQKGEMKKEVIDKEKEKGEENKEKVEGDEVNKKEEEDDLNIKKRKDVISTFTQMGFELEAIETALQQAHSFEKQLILEYLISHIPQ